MWTRTAICFVCLAFLSVGPTAHSAVVAFIGSLTGTQPGVLGSLPRNFVMHLEYTPSVGGTGSPGTSDFRFLSTPDADNPDTNPEYSVQASGNLNVRNDVLSAGQIVDLFTYNGTFTAGELGSRPVFFSFTFRNDPGTINNDIASEQNIARLIKGTAIMNLNGGGGSGVFRGSGTITGAPEPATMAALTTLVLGGCVVGYRRRMKANPPESPSED